MKLNKLILGSALIIPLFLPSCDSGKKAITITYAGEECYEAAVTESQRIASFDIKFNLNRNLSNDEHLDELGMHAISEHNASQKTGILTVNDKTINLNLTVELLPSNDVGYINNKYSITILKSTGAPVTTFVAEPIPIILYIKD